MLLLLLARLVRAGAILEVGTLAGYSPIRLARGPAPGGRLVSLEAAPEHAAVARANLERAGLDAVLDV
jgi:predicted O-methyltransferase YrrM